MSYNIQSEPTVHRQYLASSQLKPQFLNPYRQSVHSKIIFYATFYYRKLLGINN